MVDKPSPKTDDKTPVAKAAPVEKKAAPVPVLASAAASSDPAVHQVLAQIQTAQANENTGEVERLTEALNDLGFE